MINKVDFIVSLEINNLKAQEENKKCLRAYTYCNRFVNKKYLDKKHACILEKVLLKLVINI